MIRYDFATTCMPNHLTTPEIESIKKLESEILYKIDLINTSTKRKDSPSTNIEMPSSLFSLSEINSKIHVLKNKKYYDQFINKSELEHSFLIEYNFRKLYKHEKKLPTDIFDTDHQKYYRLRNYKLHNLKRFVQKTLLKEKIKKL